MNRRQHLWRTDIGCQCSFSSVSDNIDILLLIGHAVVDAARLVCPDDAQIEYHCRVVPVEKWRAGPPRLTDHHA